MRLEHGLSARTHGAECTRRHRVRRPAHAPSTLVEDVEEDVARHKEPPGRLRSTQARPRAQAHNARAAAAQRVGKGISWLDIRFGGMKNGRSAANVMRSANQDASGHQIARCKSPCAVESGRSFFALRRAATDQPREAGRRRAIPTMRTSCAAHPTLEIAARKPYLEQR